MGIRLKLPVLFLNLMPCPECDMLRDQIAIAQEEVAKLRDRIAADLAAGKSSTPSLKSLSAAERSLDRAIDSLERHLASGHAVPGSTRVVSRPLQSYF